VNFSGENFWPIFSKLNQFEVFKNPNSEVGGGYLWGYNKNTYDGIRVCSGQDFGAVCFFLILCVEKNGG